MAKNLKINPFKRQPHKIVKYTQIIRRQFADELIEFFDCFVGLALKGLRKYLKCKEKHLKKVFVETLFLIKYQARNKLVYN